MTLVCGICLYVPDRQVRDAVTVIEGYAVCEDHECLVAEGGNFGTIIRFAREMGPTAGDVGRAEDEAEAEADGG